MGLYDYKPTDGVLWVHKPMGMTSFGVVKKIRPFVAPLKIGHGGTLDPMATGLLPVLIGRATKQMERFLSMKKTYRFTMRFGAETDTEDVFGKKNKTMSFAHIDASRLADAVCSFKGEQWQTPPMVSATRYRGQRMYALARKGIVIMRPAKRITIDNIQILDIALPDVFLRVRCSRGTYVRTLCQDIGRRLASAACMASLVREQMGSHHVDHAISLEHLCASGQQSIVRAIVPMDQWCQHERYSIS